MATYKVIQDIEAEDKLIGPLTLRQFIYAGIAALSAYLGFLCASKSAAFLLVVFLPITFTSGFFAFPWGRDQPTEIWALAKIRFLIKPRLRTWDQSGFTELVTVTAPKILEVTRTNGLDQTEVKSRLNALAATIDSRGWAVKNTTLNVAEPSIQLPTIASDRLVDPTSLPQVSDNVDIAAADDILDETANPVAHKFENMITAADANRRQQIVAQLKQPDPTAVGNSSGGQAGQQPADYWFMQGQGPTVNTPGQAAFGTTPIIIPGTTPAEDSGPVAAMPTPDEEALVRKLKAENANARMTAAYGHMKVIKTPEQLAEEARQAAAAAAAQPPANPPVTPHTQAAILNLANNDDLDVATIARQAHEQVSEHDGEVVISLH